MPYRPQTDLPTHVVTNQPPPLDGVDLLAVDTVLAEGLALAPAGARDRVQALATELTDPDLAEAGRQANRFGPELRAFNRYGQRIDEVVFHPSYHRLFELGARHGVHNSAWVDGPGRSHVLHGGLEYVFAQVEAGICCPLTMTYAGVPTLRADAGLAATWTPRLLSSVYDPRAIPADQKHGSTIGMAMTEKQGGSDVRANTTQAVPIEGRGSGSAYRLTGHKFFCSAPMSDAFLTLAQAPDGLSCFLVPRWLPDGTRNPLYIQRLKDKLGNKSNASSEIEYNNTTAFLLGDEGRGVRTILEMVHHTRLDCTLAAAAIMRQALTLAVHHATGRSAFGRPLIAQPLMRNVLADLALEVEAANWIWLRVAQAFDAAPSNPQEAAFSRIAVAVGKYWNNKRCAPMVVEAMECTGGVGYVEETDFPRLYREAPLNSIWEGSGNVICLDVLRALAREPAAAQAFRDDLRRGLGGDPRIDAAIHAVDRELAHTEDLEHRARQLVERMALAFAGSLLVRHAPPPVVDAWASSRLGGDVFRTFGTLPVGADVTAILHRAWPPLRA
jgi:putative acyl-CoA dehydrogenase